MSIRAIDHLVLPTCDLDVARARLRALGFTVAPEGVHPFGTANACVYFADDTFLEPLAIVDQTLVDQALAAGNVFVARDRAFRAPHGKDGFSAVVFSTDDADHDHANFQAAGLSAGARLDFSRAYTDAAGASKSVSFRLAFAAPTTVPDTFFFTCERIDAPSSGRGALSEHDNGVTGISRIIGISRQPMDHDSLLSALVGRPSEMDDGWLRVSATNASIEILTPAAMATRYRVSPERNTELALRGIIFRVPSLQAAQEVLQASEISFTPLAGMLIVAPAPGQGAFFGFEETSA